MTKRAVSAARNYRRGLWAETLCCLVLRLKLYRIVARRYKTGLGEIDIIAARGRSLAVIEVKIRKSQELAASSISSRQQARLFRAASVFLAQHPAFAGHDLRFDAMLVAPFRLPVHIENAFADHPQIF